MEFGITIRDQNVAGLGVVPGDHHGVAAEVVFLGKVEVGQQPHVDVDENGFPGHQQIAQGMFGLVGAGGLVGSDHHSGPPPDRVFKPLGAGPRDVASASEERIGALDVEVHE